MQNTSSLFNNPTIQLSYRELRYLEQVLENYRFCQNSGNGAYGKRWGSSCRVIMTQCVRKSICDSPLIKIFYFFFRMSDMYISKYKNILQTNAEVHLGSPLLLS